MQNIGFSHATHAFRIDRRTIRHTSGQHRNHTALGLTNLATSALRLAGHTDTARTPQTTLPEP